MAKPTVTLKCVADGYAAANERIIEVGNGSRSMSTYKGCLISLTNRDDGKLYITVYRVDDGIVVNGHEMEVCK